MNAYELEHSLHVARDFLHEQGELVLSDILGNVVVAVEACTRLQDAASNGLGHGNRRIQRLRAVALGVFGHCRCRDLGQFFQLRDLLLSAFFCVLRATVAVGASEYSRAKPAETPPEHFHENVYAWKAAAFGAQKATIATSWC